jgi:hypothetical protein
MEDAGFQSQHKLTSNAMQVLFRSQVTLKLFHVHVTANTQKCLYIDYIHIHTHTLIAYRLAAVSITYHHIHTCRVNNMLR